MRDLGIPAGRVFASGEITMQDTNSILFYNGASVGDIDAVLCTAKLDVTDTVSDDSFIAQEVLGLENVSFSYEAEHPNIIRNVSLSIYPGERVLVLGPSGGGKSTLLMVLAGLIPRIINGQLKGAVRLKGVDTNSVETSLAAFSASVAIVMQDPESQIACLTVEDEVAFALENFEYPRSEIIARVNQTLQLTNMDDMRESPVYTLSGGQKQRLAIACALARSPDIIILDEPLSNLDPVGCSEVMPLIMDVAFRQGAAVVMTAHDFAGFADQFERAIIMSDGAVLKDGPIREVLGDVPLLQDLGLEIPSYIEWAYDLLGSAMEQAPLTPDEAAKLVAAAGLLPQSAACAELDFSGYGTFASEEVVVKVENLVVSFARKPVISNISFSIKRGEVVALVGYNGSGKSTLALTLAGVIPPAAGSIEVLGEKYKYRRGKKIGVGGSHIGYVFQYPEHQFLYDTMLAEMMHGLESSDEQRAVDLLSSIGLKDPLGHPYELSGGQKRRLSVKATTVLNPAILILDEPTYGQDARNRELIEKDIQTLNANGATIILIAHDMDFIARIATRVLVLRYGVLEFDGSTETLFSEDGHLESFGLLKPMTQRLRESIVHCHREGG